MKKTTSSLLISKIRFPLIKRHRWEGESSDVTGIPPSPPPPTPPVRAPNGWSCVKVRYARDKCPEEEAKVAGGRIAECRKIGRRRWRVGSGMMDKWRWGGGLLDSFCSIIMWRASTRLGNFVKKTRGGGGSLRPGPAPLLPATQSGSFSSDSCPF